ncbi:hypothetical protein Tco_0985091 [Tanacetum coccineum]
MVASTKNWSLSRTGWELCYFACDCFGLSKFNFLVWGVLLSKRVDIGTVPATCSMREWILRPSQKELPLRVSAEVSSYVKHSMCCADEIGVDPMDCNLKMHSYLKINNAHHLSFFDIKMSVRPKDVESASSVVEGRVPSRTGTAQMQSPEVDSETQLDEYGSSEGNVFSDPKTCLVSAPYLGETLSLKWMLFPDVVSLLRLAYALLILFCGLCPSVIIMEFPNGILYFLLENHVILSLFRGPFLSHMKVPPNVYVGFIKIRTRGAKVELGCLYKESVTVSFYLSHVEDRSCNV